MFEIEWKVFYSLAKRLSHISKQKIVRLIKDEILLDLDFLDFDTCVDCIKSKLITEIRNAKANICHRVS